MTETPSIEHRQAFYYTIHLMAGDVQTTEHELKELYTVLAGFFAGVSINAGNWGGLTTVEKDGAEVINGWYGSFGVADYVARSQVEKGRTKGARAYACINEYGAYKTESAPISDDDTDPEDNAPEPDPEPAKPAETLDKWIEGIA